MNEIDSINYKGIDIETFYDEDSQSPSEWDNSENFLVYDHRQFNVEVSGFDPEEINEHIQRIKRFFYEGYFVFPVYAYIHSGVSLSLGNTTYPYSDRWDVSLRGFCLIKRQKGCYTREAAKIVASGIIKTWNQYLSCDVYGYNSEAGSCWGFYGQEGYKYMVEEAKDEIDRYIQDKINEHGKQLKLWIKNHVPLSNRTACAYI